MNEIINYSEDLYSVLIDDEISDDEYDPKEAAAYLRKLLKEAKLNDMSNTLPYSREDIKDLFRVKLMDDPNRPDDGIIATCVFVYCLTHCLVDYLSFVSCGSTSPDTQTPEPDIVDNIKLVKDILARFMNDTSRAAKCYDTVSALLDKFFYNIPRPFIAELGRPIPIFTSTLNSLLKPVYILLSELSGQRFVPEKYLCAAGLLYSYSKRIFSMGLNDEIALTFIIFHELLDDFYQKHTPDDHYKLQLGKCKLLGITKERMLTSDANNFLKHLDGVLDSMGVKDIFNSYVIDDLFIINNENYYSCVYNTIEDLDDAALLGDGLFDRMDLLYYISITMP